MREAVAEVVVALPAVAGTEAARRWAVGHAGSKGKS